MCDLLMKRKMFQVKKASRLLDQDGKPRVVYVMDNKPNTMILDAYLRIGLDGLGATRVCVICPASQTQRFSRYKYDPKTDKFQKS